MLREKLGARHDSTNYLGNNKMSLGQLDQENKLTPNRICGRLTFLENTKIKTNICKAKKKHDEICYL